MGAGLAILLLAVLLIIANEVYFKPNEQYRHAAILASSGKIDDAIKAFRDLDDFKDSPEQVQALIYAKADQLAQKGNYESAAKLLYEIIDYRDSAAILQTSVYQNTTYVRYQNLVERAVVTKDYFTAAKSFIDFGNYLDSRSLAIKYAILDLRSGDSSYSSFFSMDNDAAKPEQIGFWSIHLRQDSIDVYNYFTNFNSEDQKITNVELLPDQKTYRFLVVKIGQIDISKSKNGIYVKNCKYIKDGEYE